MKISSEQSSRLFQQFLSICSRRKLLNSSSLAGPRSGSRGGEGLQAAAPAQGVSSRFHHLGLPGGAVAWMLGLSPTAFPGVTVAAGQSRVAGIWGVGAARGIPKVWGAWAWELELWPSMAGAP